MLHLLDLRISQYELHNFVNYFEHVIRLNLFSQMRYSYHAHREQLNTMQWASYQIRKIAGCPCAGNAGNVFPPSWVSDPDMHHDTCVTHVPWCMSGSITSGFLWSRWRGKRSRHSRRMRNPQFCVSRKRPMRQATSWLYLTGFCFFLNSGTLTLSDF